MLDLSHDACRTEQLRTAMGQWQNKTVSAAFTCWRDHVVTKTAHSAKVNPYSLDVQTTLPLTHS